MDRILSYLILSYLICNSILLAQTNPKTAEGLSSNVSVQQTISEMKKLIKYCNDHPSAKIAAGAIGGAMVGGLAIYGAQYVLLARRMAMLMKDFSKDYLIKIEFHLIYALEDALEVAVKDSEIKLASCSCCGAKEYPGLITVAEEALDKFFKDENKLKKVAQEIANETDVYVRKIEMHTGGDLRPKEAQLMERNLYSWLLSKENKEFRRIVISKWVDKRIYGVRNVVSHGSEFLIRLFFKESKEAGTFLSDLGRHVAMRWCSVPPRFAPEVAGMVGKITKWGGVGLSVLADITWTSQASAATLADAAAEDPSILLHMPFEVARTFIDCQRPTCEVTKEKVHLLYQVIEQARAEDPKVFEFENEANESKAPDASDLVCDPAKRSGSW
jgi:hypothetical protein